MIKYHAAAGETRSVGVMHYAWVSIGALRGTAQGCAGIPTLQYTQWRSCQLTQSRTNTKQIRNRSGAGQIVLYCSAFAPRLAPVPGSGQTIGAPEDYVSRPTAYITRRLPQAALEIVAATCAYRLWDSDDQPVPRATLLQAAADSDGVLAMLSDRIDAEFLALGGDVGEVDGLCFVRESLVVEGVAGFPWVWGEGVVGA